MSKKILGLDIGSNSIGWALLEGDDGKASNIIDLGSRIFTKAVEDKTPTPKNVKRRDSRLTRRVLQRRARRKQRMLNYLVKLKLLPQELSGHTQPEVILNDLGDPYQLRKKGLDSALTAHEMGRVLLHLVQRRGFLSNRKTLLGDMADDPDVLDVLEELEGEGDTSTEAAKEETAFKKDISELRKQIEETGSRTLGEYLAGLGEHSSKRNRSHDGGHLRTDRKMYFDELNKIWEVQEAFHDQINSEVKEQIDQIIFYQRPLKLRSDRIGKCSLEPSRKRSRIGRLEYQRFRYLQDINNLAYFDPYQEKNIRLTSDQRKIIVAHFEAKANPTFAQLRTLLGFGRDKTYSFNLETDNKKLKGNITRIKVKSVCPQWDEFSEEKQYGLIEDLLTINKKSVLKSRLINHWHLPLDATIDLCLLEFEPGHGNLSVKAINKLLPFLEDGYIYSDAREKAGYGYEREEIIPEDKLGKPPATSNPIVNKGLQEVRRVVNAIIKEYGKPDIIRIEMARDLEMNTKRYKAQQKQQNQNTKANEDAQGEFEKIGKANPHLKLRTYASRQDKLKYRLWKDQDTRCAYSGKVISLSILFSGEIEIDHILPYSQSLDDSYMNKVVCYAAENQKKGQQTPRDAFGHDEEKWNQIAQAVSRWDKSIQPKKNRFYQRAEDVQARDFISSQLNDTRYITRVALDYLATLGSDITTCKGQITAWLRHQWGLNSLIGVSDKKERIDHRHHAIDAAVVATVDRGFYNTLVNVAKQHERNHPELQTKDLGIDPPWDALRDDMEAKLADVVIAHDAQNKLNGALHEETGVGYVHGKGTVTRKTLGPEFKQVSKIYDEGVRELIQQYLEKHGNDPKKAFAEGFRLVHKDGKTPIKRVRILQSFASLKKLEKQKFGVKNKDGEVFKWLAYGNYHHVEIVKNKKTGKHSGKFVTMMEANHRAKGIGMAKQPIVKTDHGDDHEFVTSLVINDLVELENAEGQYYRVQKMSDTGRMHLRLHTASTLDLEKELITMNVGPLFEKYNLKKVLVNSIGKLKRC
ncbi:type II CRISPR RNA-guided endonuclease Cas9 [Gammaproteobacteria bacterium]|nr:type II CRISPR RNA-guided endonuclease Cas9 [Gammaproteobacteria bacterium]